MKNWGGHFTPELGGQFELESGGHFKLELGGQYHRNMHELQESQLKISAPKVEYYDEVLQSNSTYTTNQIAKELGMSAIGLNAELSSLGIQYKQSGTWLLYSKYQNKGYTKTKTHSFTDNHGKIQTSMATVWTESGRLFIHDNLRIQKAS